MRARERERESARARERERERKKEREREREREIMLPARHGEDDVEALEASKQVMKLTAPPSPTYHPSPPIPPTHTHT